MTVLPPTLLTNRIINSLFNDAAQVNPVANARVMSCLHHPADPVLYKGWNQFKTHPFQKKFAKNEHCIYLHAEVDSIVKYLRYNRAHTLPECTMVVVRAKKDKSGGKWVHGLAKPCEGCQRAIAAFGIKNVVYTTGDPNFPLDHL